ncbi:MAG: HAD hydrolase family protein [bacterium]
MKMIEIIVVDIDGCITPGEGEAADLVVLARLAEFNRSAQHDPHTPHITLCTGRQGPYADLMCQLIGATKPAIFEHGSGFYLPQPYEFIAHPLITEEKLRMLAEMKRIVNDRIVKTQLGKTQPGKEYSLSVYPKSGLTVDALGDNLAEICEENGFDFVIDKGVKCVNIFFSGIDKGEGVRWLAEYEGLDLARIGGIGDAQGDLPFLEIVGFSATPANGQDSLKKKVAYLSPYENGKGTIDIIEKCIEKNAAVKGQ